MAKTLSIKDFASASLNSKPYPDGDKREEIDFSNKKLCL